jgi:hypothetical protein
VPSRAYARRRSEPARSIRAGGGGCRHRARDGGPIPGWSASRWRRGAPAARRRRWTRAPSTGTRGMWRAPGPRPCCRRPSGPPCCAAAANVSEPTRSRVLRRGSIVERWSPGRGGRPLTGNTHPGTPSVKEDGPDAREIARIAHARLRETTRGRGRADPDDRPWTRGPGHAALGDGSEPGPEMAKPGGVTPRPMRRNARPPRHTRRSSAMAAAASATTAAVSPRVQ